MSANHNFELFTGRYRSIKPDRPRICLGKRRNFYLNAAAYDLLGSPSAVVLMFDRETQAIGLRPAELSTRHAHGVRKQQGARSYIIGAIAFTRAYNLPLDSKTLVFTPKVEDGIVVLELANATARPVRSYSKKNQ